MTTPPPPLVMPMIRDGLWRCVVCHGTGILPGESPPHRHDCPNCKGKGYLPPEKYRPTSFYRIR